MKGLCYKRMNGFTMMEVIVSISISGIVILAAITFYDSFSRLSLRKNSTMELSMEMLQFYKAVYEDTGKSINITSTNSAISFTTIDKKLIRYEIDKNYIVREVDSESDTFHLEISDFGISEAVLKPCHRLVFFEIFKDNFSIPLTIEKRLTNAELMNSLFMKSN